MDQAANEAENSGAGALNCGRCGGALSLRAPHSKGSYCSYCLLQLGTASSGFGLPTITRFRLTESSSTDAELQFLRAGVLPQFGDYELLSEIARGGMGVVYRARQRSLNRLVAVKMILAGQLATPESLQRFRLEAEAAARLHHPGIVPIYEIGEFETQHYFSMELIDGASLAECLAEFTVDPRAKSGVRRDQERCVAELTARVARALDFAHQHGVLHRDLKPSNILIDQEGLPHLTDFGLAKLTGRETSGLTLSHAVLGTPGYLAPEQAAGSDDITTAADVYGLGATLYELLTGRPPFVGNNAMETMLKAINEEPVGLRQINPTIHRDLETIALRCIDKRPDRRYPTAGAVADELERFLRGEPIEARPITNWERMGRWCQRNPVMAALAATLLIAIVSGTSAALWQWRRAEAANTGLTESVQQLQWEAIDEMSRAGQSSRALAKVASLLRDDPSDWKAAMFGMSVMEQRRFPVPAAPPIRHPEGTELTVARLSPDGKRIVTASLDGTARLWDSKTSASLLPPLQHAGPVTWAEFSPDGKLLVTCSTDKTARLWDVAKGEPVGKSLEHSEGVVQAQFSDDGRLLLIRTTRFVSLYEVATQRRLRDPIEHAGKVVAAKFVAGGKYLFTAQQAGPNSLAQAWDVVTGQQLVRLETGPLVDADITEDLTRIVTVNSSERGFIWDIGKGKKWRELTSTGGSMVRAVFNPQGNRIATQGHNHWCRIWDAETGTPTSPELPHYYLVNGLQFAEDGEQLMTWGMDSLLQLWDGTTGEPVAEAMRHLHRVMHAEAGVIEGQEVYLAALAHGKSREVGVGTGVAQLWRVPPKREPIKRDRGFELHGHDGGTLSPDGQWLALGRTSQEVWVIDVASGETVCGPLPVQGGPWGVHFTGDSRRLITVTSRGQVAVWSLPDGKLLFEPAKLPTTYQPSVVANDGQRFVTGSTDGFVRVWTSETGRPIWEKQHGAEVNSVDFSPDDQWVASGGEDRLARIWYADSGEILHTLVGHRSEVMRVYFSPDNRRLVTASLDFSARVWDVATGKDLFVLPHQGEVIDAAFSPNGQYIATGSRDRTAVIWNARTGLPERSMLHEQGVRNVRFSLDSQWLLTLDFRGPQLWDVATGHPLTVHLSQMIGGGTGFQGDSARPEFSLSGDMIWVAGDSPLALLWPITVPTGVAPRWFPEFLEAVAGQRFVAGKEAAEVVGPTEFLQLREQIQASRDDDHYTRWAQQWLAEFPSSNARSQH